MNILSRVIAILAAVLLAASTAYAQTPGREITLDLRPWSVDAGLAWRVSAGHLLGFSVGGGPDDFNRTLLPEIDELDSEFVTLEQIVRLGPFWRHQPRERLDLDLGLRAALGGVRGISGSPGLVTGVHVGAFYGGRRIRIGTRIFVGTSREAGTTEPVVHLDWLTARLRFAF